MKKNRMMICGKNTSTLPTPASTPLMSKSLIKLLRQCRSQPIAEYGDAEFDFVHGHLRPRKYGLKYQEQDHRENHRSEHRMQHQRIEPIAEGHAIETVAADYPKNSAHLRLIVLDIPSAQGSPRGGRA